MHMKGLDRGKRLVPGALDPPAEWTALDRIRFAVVATAAHWVIRAIGPTLRWEVEGWENFREVEAAGRRRIFTFWHGRTVMAAWFYRNQGIVVMVSRNKDGEYIGRVIRRLGYGTARGSSSRGGGRALVQMLRELRRERDVAFTVDGPRGPRYVAKAGPVWLAARSGHPILPFHVSARNRWEFSSWDGFQVPRPFTRCFMLVGSPLYVREGATEAEQAEMLQKLQDAMDALRERGDAHWESAAER